MEKLANGEKLSPPTKKESESKLEKAVNHNQSSNDRLLEVVKQQAMERKKAQAQRKKEEIEARR